MRTIRMVIAVLILIAVMVLMAANMTPVDLHLLPAKFAPGMPVLANVPVAIVIVASLVTGIVVGLLMEYAREAKHRRRLDSKRREVSELRDQNAQLAKKLDHQGDEIAAITG